MGVVFPPFVCKLVKFLPVYELLWLEPVQEHKVQADFLYSGTKGGVSGTSGGRDYLSWPLPPPPTPTLCRARLERQISCFCPVNAALPARKQVQEKSLFLAAGSMWGPSQESCFRFIENCCVLAEHDIHKTNVRF